MSAIANAPAELADDQPRRRTRLPIAMLAPWLACIRPGVGARRLAGASMTAITLVFLLQWLITAPVAMALPVLEGMLEIVPLGSERPGVEVRWTPVEQVWRQWRAGPAPLPPAVVLMLVGILVPVLTALGTAVHVCTVHRRGRLGPSFRHAFAAIVAASGPLIALLAIAGTAAVLSNELATPIAAGAVRIGGLPGEVLAVLSGASGVVILLAATSRAAAGAELEGGEIEVPPRCEGCGYDLTHTPAEARCSECGLAASRSLGEESGRVGVEWQRSASVRSLVETSFSSLVGPRAFYSALRLRDPDQSIRYRRFHFAAAVALATAYSSLIFLSNAPRSASGGAVGVAAFAMLVALVVSALSWTACRIAAAIAVVPWLLGDRLPDFRWARRVMNYESVFLWVLFCFNAVVFTPAMLGVAPWMFRTRGFFSVPLWHTVVLFGNLGLGLVLIWRHQIALRAVRWSNY